MDRSGPQFTGAFGSFTLGGTESFVVEIRDAAGNVLSSPSRVVLVNPCPS